MASKGKKGPKTAGISDEHIVQVAVTAVLPRLIPLNDGNHVYFFDPLTLRCHHIDTHTVAFAEILRESCDLGLAPRIRQELLKFAELYPDNEWEDRITDLEMAGVLS